METRFIQHPELVLEVSPEKVEFFSLLLQSGILLTVPSGITIGAFLEGISGFSEEYIVREVQTIFLNGTATDDLDTPIRGGKATLAVSAAMPGLAGAIFRKNSLHAALRTKAVAIADTRSESQVTITLKLFNAIARDRGAALLGEGVVMRASHVQAFFETRPSLLKSIMAVNFNRSQTEPAELQNLLTGQEIIFIRIAVYNETS